MNIGCALVCEMDQAALGNSCVGIVTCYKCFTHAPRRSIVLGVVYGCENHSTVNQFQTELRPA